MFPSFSLEDTNPHEHTFTNLQWNLLSLFWLCYPIKHRIPICLSCRPNPDPDSSKYTQLNVVCDESVWRCLCVWNRGEPGGKKPRLQLFSTCVIIQHTLSWKTRERRDEGMKLPPWQSAEAAAPKRQKHISPRAFFQQCHPKGSSYHSHF